MAHKLFLGFLFLITISATAAVAVKGFSYYVTPVSMRPFRSDYEAMKPSGVHSHALGIIGASMIIVGVMTYSTRKRARLLRELGKLPRWLEFHIFLCLLGPVLIVYHSTFKAGGIAAISLWCMLSVALSGVIGRFLYVQIPRNLKGAELTHQDISGELDRLGGALSTSPVGARLVETIDAAFAGIPRSGSLGVTVRVLLRLQALRRGVKRSVLKTLAKNHVPEETARELLRLASARTVLLQKTVVLSQVGKLFFYWHAVHLPFTIIMFLTLAAHVTVAIVLGYWWIF